MQIIDKGTWLPRRSACHTLELELERQALSRVCVVPAVRWHAAACALHGGPQGAATSRVRREAELVPLCVVLAVRWHAAASTGVLILEIVSLLTLYHSHYHSPSSSSIVLLNFVIRIIQFSSLFPSCSLSSLRPHDTLFAAS